MSESTIQIALVLPDLLGTYGDFGNAVVLEKRMTWRGIKAEIVPINYGEPVPDSCDIYVVGGGEDTAQTLAVKHLREHPGLQRAVTKNAVVLGVCAGIQIFGESFTRADNITHPGMGLIDSTSHAGGSRAIGEVLAEPANGLFEGVLTGFENHQGRTVLGPSAQPLAHVKVGRWQVAMNAVRCGGCPGGRRRAEPPGKAGSGDVTVGNAAQKMLQARTVEAASVRRARG